MTVPMIKSIGDVPYPIDTHSDTISPLLTAGAALGITGEATDSAAWLQRVSTSDGPTTIRSIKGNTLVWNQLNNNGILPSTSSGVTITSNGDGSVTISGTSTEDTTIRIGLTPIKANHKYLIKGCPAGGGNNTYDLNVSGIGKDYGSGDIASYPSDADNTAIRLHVRNGQTFDNVVAWPQMFDLTTMFGAGNEPSTVAEFEALFPLPYYEYDAGSLLPVNMTGIATEDANGDPIQTRSIPAGILRSAGTVYDELTATERITRVGEVDLGTLTWGKVSTTGEHWRFAATLNTMAAGLDMTCAKYDVITTTAQWRGAMGISAQVNGSDFIVMVSDEVYADVAAFKQAMSGVMLHYALATPTVTPHEQPLNMTYRTAAGGTERVMVPTGENSAPPTIVTAQGYTAESLRDAALSAIAPVENGLASTNYAVGSYLVHGGQLCRVTTAIATGEAISIGINVTATTVMAEVIALIAQ